MSLSKPTPSNFDKLPDELVLKIAKLLFPDMEDEVTVSKRSEENDYDIWKNMSYIRRVGKSLYSCTYNMITELVLPIIPTTIGRIFTTEVSPEQALVMFCQVNRRFYRIGNEALYGRITTIMLRKPAEAPYLLLKTLISSRSLGTQVKSLNLPIVENSYPVITRTFVRRLRNNTLEKVIARKLEFPWIMSEYPYPRKQLIWKSDVDPSILKDAILFNEQRFATLVPDITALIDSINIPASLKNAWIRDVDIFRPVAWLSALILLVPSLKELDITQPQFDYIPVTPVANSFISLLLYAQSFGLLQELESLTLNLSKGAWLIVMLMGCPRAFIFPKLKTLNLISEGWTCDFRVAHDPDLDCIYNIDTVTLTGWFSSPLLKTFWYRIEDLKSLTVNISLCDLEYIDPATTQESLDDIFDFLPPLQNSLEFLHIHVIRWRGASKVDLCPRNLRNFDKLKSLEFIGKFQLHLPFEDVSSFDLTDSEGCRHALDQYGLLPRNLEHFLCQPERV
ncbi:hypothetical protein P280DRAFT_484798 [Massarina eburnea CBS 473.64]|uniref:Uncharacterized protein n=1 Tax=Massarina eburnea CBS 473.64 TaxID=1395130 RepID=A0A6A6RM98_9PLEO|nr:hypothetical protein P280DRAFT_484798 [Massarina eburnea CBS 473.64]